MLKGQNGSYHSQAIDWRYLSQAVSGKARTTQETDVYGKYVVQ